MTTRAKTAEQRAVVAEGQVTALKLTIAALQHRLDSENQPAKPNRQAGRAAERDARRGRP
ncbi:MAG: hypothetical protein ACRDVP_10810 [Acidimicrobiales bacterium]